MYRQWRRLAQVDDRGQLVRRGSDEVAVVVQGFWPVLERVVQRTGEHGPADRVQAVLELGDDAEVAAASAKSPQQVRSSSALTYNRAVGGHEHRAQTGCRRSRRSGGISQPMPLPSVRPAILAWSTIPPVVASPRAWRGFDRTSPHRSPPWRGLSAVRIHRDPAHRRQVHHDVRPRGIAWPRDAVPAAAHRHLIAHRSRAELERGLRHRPRRGSGRSALGGDRSSPFQMARAAS